MQNAIQEAGVLDRLLLFIGRRRGYVVSGASMFPTLNEGDRVLIDPRADIAEGDIVLAKHPYKQSVQMLKRVEQIDADGRYWLTGDNPAESSDSRMFGWIQKSDVLGKVISRL